MDTRYTFISLTYIPTISLTSSESWLSPIPSPLQNNVGTLCRCIRRERDSCLTLPHPNWVCESIIKLNAGIQIPAKKQFMWVSNPQIISRYQTLKEIHPPFQFTSIVQTKCIRWGDRSSPSPCSEKIEGYLFPPLHKHGSWSHDHCSTQL